MPRPNWARAGDHDSWLAVGRDLATLHATSARAAPWSSAGWLLDSVAAPDWALVHGDCHTDNLIRENGSLVWVDRQGVGVGNPAAHLAFLSVRAAPSGAAPPLDAIVTRDAAVRGPDVDQVLAATTATELIIFLLTWPQYARHNSTRAIERARAAPTGSDQRGGCCFRPRAPLRERLRRSRAPSR